MKIDLLNYAKEHGRTNNEQYKKYLNYYDKVCEAISRLSSTNDRIKVENIIEERRLTPKRVMKDVVNGADAAKQERLRRLSLDETHVSLRTDANITSSN